MFKVTDRRFPKWDNLQPETEYKIDVDAIDVSLVMAPPLEDLLEMAPKVLMTTWDPVARTEKNKDKLEQFSDEDKMKLLYRACQQKFLPAFMETINFVVCFDGISLQDVTHLIRSRSMSFFGDCSGDTEFSKRDILMPEAFKGKYEDRFKALTYLQMQLYCDLMNDKDISHWDARLVRPVTLETFYHVRMNLGDAMRVCKQRFCPQTQPGQDLIMMQQLWLALCKEYEFLSWLPITYAYKDEEWFFKFETKTNFSSRFYQPLPQNEAVLEDRTPEDFLYDKTPLECKGRGENSSYARRIKEYEDEIEVIRESAKEKWPFLFDEQYNQDFIENWV